MFRVVEFVDDSSKMTNVFQHEAFCDYFRQRQNESYTKNEMNVKILNQRKKRKMIQTQNELRENIFRIVYVMIITIINVEDFKLYSIFNSNLIIVNEIVRLLKTNNWNFFVNYRNFFIILVENQRQLRFVVQKTFKKNVFVYFMNMSLFHHLKFLNHFSMMFRIQYRMMNVIERMISTLFMTMNSSTHSTRNSLKDRSFKRWYNIIHDDTTCNFFWWCWMFSTNFNWTIRDFCLTLSIFLWSLNFSSFWWNSTW